MAHFNINTRGGYKPEHGGIDWYALRTRKLGELGLVAAEIWFVYPEEEYEQQVTQENTFIDLNQMSEHMDSLTVIDGRDGECWVNYRDESPNFEATLEAVNIYSTVTRTMYPQEHVVDHYELRRLGELAKDLDQA